MEEAELYPIAKRDSESIVNEICKTYGVSKTATNWKYFEELLQTKYNVIIEPKNFKNIVLSKRLAGELVIGDNKAIISYNNGCFQTVARQHFTIVHEGVHYMKHRVDHKNGEHFSDILKNGAYSPKESEEELLTNQTASLIMLNDGALEQCMQNRWSYGKITGFYGMSGSALFERLVNYLHFNLKIKSESARYLVGRFRYGDTVEACGFLPILTTNFDRFVDWFNDFPLTGNMLDELYLNLGLGFEAPASHWYQLNHIFSKTNLNASIAVNMQK